MRAYKVEPSVTAQNTETPAVTPVESGGSASAGGASGSSGGSSVSSGGVGGGVGGVGAKAGAGGELFKVDLDPTGMYAAACSFDKVCVIGS